MDFFYDGQIRRYVSQVIRMLSGFKYRTGDGTEKVIPVMYGDMTRQVAAIIKENSSNKLPSVPRISVYITDLQLDRNRLSDATYVSKVHIRERNYDPDTGDYDTTQGGQYTVERLMPTPYNMTLKADIWAGSTDQKLQILEQLLVLFNPSLELQTTDNYIDWTSLTRVELTDMIFSSRTIPVGGESEIDIGTLTFETPIYISPPAKVKKLGIITNIIMNIYNEEEGTIQGIDEFGNNIYYPTNKDLEERVSISGFGIVVFENQIKILLENEPVSNPFLSHAQKLGQDLDWRLVLDQYPGKFKAGLSKIYLQQEDSTEVVGTLAAHPTDASILTVSWDADSFHTDTILTSSYLPAGRGNFDAIINPLTFNPQTASAGIRYLIIDDIGDPNNVDGPEAWKNADTTDFTASVNDIIEWNGSAWSIVFDASSATDLTYQTNNYTGIQYKWTGTQWVKSFEGVYRQGYWRLVL